MSCHVPVVDVNVEVALMKNALPNTFFQAQQRFKIVQAPFVGVFQKIVPLTWCIILRLFENWNYDKFYLASVKCGRDNAI